MCSVVGCDSGRRGARRFKLPEDPERRLEWVQFLATVNTQRFKESSWTDITICSEHFRDDCFDSRTPNHPGVTGEVLLTLGPGAVPSLCLQSEEHETTCVEPEETTEVACLRDQLKTRDGPTAFSEESMAVQGSPTEVLSCSTDPNAFVSGQMQPKHMDFDLIGQKAALLQMKGKYVVNEKRLLQLFSRKCPSCGSKVKMEKVTCGLLIVLNQQCLQCDYRNQWKSQVDASVPTDEDQHLTEVEEVTPESQQGATGVHEIVAVIDEQSEPIDESSDEGDLDSGRDWKPVNGSSHARVLIKKIEEETEDEDEEEEEEEEEEDDDDDDDEDEDGDYPPLPVKHSRLCAECGVLYNKRRPHTCEHKIKPFSCNICGKRCVSEKALITHSRIHDENYEYQCKFCHATFKTKVDKITHEQIHVTQGKPYKCPDCPETFATNKERRIHLEGHRGPQQLKCHICGIDFLWPLSLQRHLAVHTGDRPFKCSECQRGFKQAGHLKSHMRLHTGERPYKCPHCDKSFNHNVSLKSHVQRHHSPGSGREQMKEKRNKRASDTRDAQDNENKRGADSGLDNVEDEQDTEEEEEEEEEAQQREMIYRPKKKSTGRPIGRPKRHEPGNSEEGQSSNAKSGKPRARNSKRTQCRDDESEAKPSDSGTCDSAEEEEESSKETIKKTARSRRRPNDSESDCDFDPQERKKKRYSSGKSSGKRRGRPRKNLKGDSLNKLS